MGRNRALPVYQPWNVASTRSGYYLILDAHGVPIFEHPDRLSRLNAIYLAAQAPPLEVAVRELMRTVDYLSTDYHSFRPLMEFAALTLRMGKPPEHIISQVEPIRHQGELDLGSDWLRVA